MEKIKQFVDSDAGKDILTVLIVVLVGLGSFGLGRLSKDTAHEGLSMEYQAVAPEAEASAIKALLVTPKASGQATSGQFFASSKGSKYYPVGCSAGKGLKQENRVYFDTRESAEKAGYELSGSCR